MGLLSNSTQQPIDLRALYFNTPPPQTLRAPPAPTFAEKLADYVARGAQKVGVKPRSAGMFGRRASAAVEALTPFGAATEAQQAKRSFGSGNYGAAAGHALGALLSALPDGGAALAKGGGAVAHSIIAPLFHGSPHKFDKFMLEKIGTGEGAQAYGHGLYFAENKGVATDYRQKLAGYGHTYSIDGQDFGRINDLPTAREAYAKLAPDLSPLAEVDPRAPAFVNSYGPVQLGSVIRDIDYTKSAALPDILAEQAAGYRKAAEKATDPRDKAERLGKAIIADTLAQRTSMGRAGHLYEVAVDANPTDFLDWNAKLGAQPEVADRLASLDNPLVQAWRQNGAFPNVSGETLYRQLADGLTRGAVQRGAHAAASGKLKNAGVSGIRYLDQGSRTAGHGTHNYVVFDPDIIDILNRH